MGAFQSATKPGDFGEFNLQIRAKNPPISNKELRRMGYARFKEQSQLVPRYQTYYPEIRQSQKNNPLCPTFQQERHGKTQHKAWKTPEQRQKQYRDELQAMRLRPNSNCHQLHDADGDLDRHLRYHCGNNENPPIDQSLLGGEDKHFTWIWDTKGGYTGVSGKNLAQ